MLTSLGLSPALASVDEKLAATKLDLSLVYTNDFVRRANAKYPKG